MGNYLFNGFSAIILARRQSEYPSLLKIDEAVIILGVLAGPVLKISQAQRCAESPLVIRIKKAFFHQLSLVIEKVEGVFAGIFIEPFQDKFAAQDAEGFGGYAQVKQQTTVHALRSESWRQMDFYRISSGVFLNR